MTIEPNDLPLELLAAYVDGELGPRDRARVEWWLEDHPEARELVEVQECWTPANNDHWFALTPPQPGDRQWAKVMDGISRGIRPFGHRRWAGWSGAALFATALAVFIVIASTSGSGTPTPENRPIDSVHPVVFTEAPYAMAGDDDVRIVSLPEDAAAWLVVGEHPLSDSILKLAKADELDFIGVGSDLDGRFPDVPTDPTNTEAPVLWAPR